jgi:hypothetical protein
MEATAESDKWSRPAESDREGGGGPRLGWKIREEAGSKSRKRISKLKFEFLNLPRLWKFVEGDLGGILT